MLPHNFPSLQKLNTFVIAVYDTDKEKYVFLDSSMDIPSLNILPPDLSVNQARILSPTEKEENKWVDLMMLTENTSFMNIKAKLEGNLIKGHRSTVLHGQEAVEYQKKRQQEQDSIVPDPTTEITPKDRLTVTNLKVEHTENDPGTDKRGTRLHHTNRTGR